MEDERLALNPCKIRGGDVERAAERPFVDAEVVLDLAGAIEERYRALVLLAGFGGLRLGELLALRRSGVDLVGAVVRVEVQAVELRTGDRIVTAPKTDAGRRAVHLPAVVTMALETHLLGYTGARPDALVFTGPLSEALRRATSTRPGTRPAGPSDGRRCDSMTYGMRRARWRPRRAQRSGS